MSLKIGSTSIGALYLGSTKIAQAYLGNVKVYESAVQLPAYTLRYKFYDSSFDPTTISGGKGTWTQVSSSSNVWDWTYQVSGGVTNWSFGPFSYTASSASAVHLTGLYDIIAAGDNTGVGDMSYFFGIYNTENTTGCTTNGPVNVCDLHLRPTGVASLFRWCPTLEYFAGNIDISRCSTFSSMYSHTSITTLPPFTGTQLITAGSSQAVHFTYFVNGCQYLTSVANLNTLDLRYDDLSAMDVNDGITFNCAFHDTPNLVFTGDETDSWNANAVPIRVFGDVTGGSSSLGPDIPLSPNKVNLFKWRMRNSCRFMYLFNGAGLTTIPDFTTFNLTGCDFTGCFENNVNVTSGALAAYNKLSSLAGTAGTDCFLDCGSNTQTGQADLDQIPQSWGGNYVVQDLYVGTNWKKSKNSATYGTLWQCTYNVDFATLQSMQIYTEASVSAYAGVNMRKTNIGCRRGNFSNATSSPCYYWPAFMQFTGNGGTSDLSWLLISTSYNGTLGSGASSGDMPGTLSYNTYGNHSVQFGTYSSDRPTPFFGFVVTNTDTLDSTVLTNFGILYNSNLKTDPVLRAVTATVTPQSAIIT